MNENAIKDAYNLFVSQGYKKSEEDFKVLMSENSDALNDAYGLFVSQGYKKGIEDFAVLMGADTSLIDKKKEEAAAANIPGLFPGVESDPLPTEEPSQSPSVEQLTESFLRDNPSPTEEQSEQFLSDLKARGIDVSDEGNFMEQAIMSFNTSKTFEPFRRAGAAAIILDDLNVGIPLVGPAAKYQKFQNWLTETLVGTQDAAVIKAQQTSKAHRVYDFSDVNGEDYSNLVKKAIDEAKNMGSSEYQEILSGLPDDEELNKRYREAKKYREQYEKAKDEDPTGIAAWPDPKTNEQVKEEYIQEKFVATSGSKIKDNIMSILPDELKNNKKFVEMLTDRIYDEAGVPTDLDGDNRYNDVPLAEYFGKMLDTGTYSIVSAVDYGLTAAAGMIDNDPNSAQINKEKRAEINANLEEINSLNTQFIGGISESIAMGDMGNAVQQTLGGLTQTLPIMGLTLATAPIGGTPGLIAGAALTGTIGGIQTYVGIRDMQVVDPNDPNKMIDAYTESTALGQAFVSGLGEAAFSIVGGKIFQSASTAASANKLIGVSRGSMKSFVKGIAKEYGLAMTEEGLTEFTTELTNYIAESQLKKGAEFNLSEALRAGADAFIVGSVAGAGFKTPGDLISGNLNYNSYAAGALFDPANIEVYSRIDSEISIIREALENESDPKKKKKYESQISQLELTKKQVRQERSSFFDAMYVRAPETMEILLKRDGEIHEALAKAREAKADGNLALEKNQKEKARVLAKAKMDIIDKFSAEFEASPLTAEEKSNIYKKKMDDAVNDVNGRISDIEESLYAMYAEAETSTGEIEPLYRKRLDELQSQLDDANLELEALEDSNLKIADARKRINEISAKQREGKATKEELAEMVSLVNLTSMIQTALGVTHGTDFANDRSAIDPKDYDYELATQAELDELLSLSTSTNMDKVLGAISSSASSVSKVSGAIDKTLVSARELLRSDLKEELNLSSNASFIDNEIKKPLGGSGTFAHMTAENPGAQQLSPEENAKRNEELRQKLIEEGYKVVEISGRYGNPEKSFFVKNITLEDAMRFGEMFGQESVAHSEGLVYTAGENKGKMHPPTGDVLVDQDLDDNYSFMRTDEGSVKYQVGYDWDSPLVDIPSKQTETKVDDTPVQVETKIEEGSVDVNDNKAVRELINESVKNGDADSYTTNDDGSIGVQPTGVLSGKLLSDLNKSVAGLSKTLGKGLRVVVAKSTAISDKFSGEGFPGGFYDPLTGTIYIDPTAFNSDKELRSVIFEEIAHGAFNDVVASMDVNSRVNLISDFLDVISSDFIEVLDKKIRDYSSAMNVPVKSESKSGREFILDNIGTDLFAKEAVAEIMGSIDVEAMKPSVFKKISSLINSVMSKIFPGKSWEIKDKTDMQRFVDAMAKIKSGEKTNINKSGNIDSVSYSLEGKNEAVNTSQSELRKAFPDREFISPFEMPDGPITITYDKSFYRRGKDIGSEPVVMKFNNKDHFINWWKKTTFDNKRYGANRTGFYTEYTLSKRKPKKLEFSNHRIELDNGKTVFIDTDMLINKYKPWISDKKSKKPFIVPFYKKRGKLSQSYNNISSDAQAAFNDGLISEGVYNETIKKLMDITAWGIDVEMKIERGEDVFGKYSYAEGRYNEITERLGRIRVDINKSISKAAESKGDTFRYEDGGKFYSDKSRGSDQISYYFSGRKELTKDAISSMIDELNNRMDGLPLLACKKSLKDAAVREICLDIIRRKYPDATPKQRLGYATLIEAEALVKAFNEGNDLVQANPLDFQANSLAATEILAENVFDSLDMPYRGGFLPLYRAIVAITSNGTDRVSNFVAANSIFKAVLMNSKTDTVSIPDSIIKSLKNRDGVFKDLNGSRVETMAKHLGLLNEDIKPFVTKNGQFRGQAFAAKIQSKAKTPTGKISKKGKMGWTYGMERYGGKSVGKLGAHFSVMMGGDALVLDSNHLNFKKKFTQDLMDYSDQTYFFKRAINRVKELLSNESVDIEGLDDYEVLNVAKVVKEANGTKEETSKGISKAFARLATNEVDADFSDNYDLVMEAKKFIEESLGENSEEVRSLMNTLSSSQRDMFYTTGADGKRTFTFPVHLFQAVAYASEQAYRKTSQRNNIKGYTDDLVVAKQILGAESEADIDAMIKQSKLDYENEQMSSALVNYDQSTFGPDEALNTEQLSVDAVELNTENARDVRFLEDVTFKPNAENISKARNFEEVQKDSLMDIDGKESNPSDIPDTATEVIFNPLISDYPMTKNLEVIKTASRVILIDGKMYVDGNISIGDHAVTDGDAVDGKSYSEITGSAKEKILSYAVNQLGMNPKDVDVDYIYDKMTKETLIKMNSEGSFASNLKSNSDAISYSIRLRETAKKGAKRVPGAKEQILANPENYITPQRLKEIKAILPRMSDAELINEIESVKLATLMGAEDNFGALAAGELINREIANAEVTGNYDRVADLYSDAAKMGTTAGRILRQLRELQSTTPIGMARSIQVAAQKSGNYLTPEQVIKVEQASEKLLNATNNYNDLSGRARAGEDVETELKKAFEDLMSAKKNIGELTNRYVGKGFGDIFTQLIQGNLLTPESHQTNLSSNLLRVFDMAFFNAFALPVERVLNLMIKGKNVSTRKYSVLAQLEGLKGLARGTREAFKTAITGQDPDTKSEWRMSAGLMPIRSLLDAVTGNDLPLNDRGKVNWKNRTRLFIQGVLGLSPEFNFRLLGLADTPFRKYAEAVELYHMGQQRGLEGQALRDFIRHPDLKSLEVAELEGRKLTFQQDSSSSKAAMELVNGVERIIGMGLNMAFDERVIDGKQAAKVFVRVITPYVKTPANILSESLTYISPYYAGLRIVADLRKGDNRSAAQNFGKAIVGSIAAETAMILIREGLVTGSAGYEDKEDEALTNMMYDHFQPDAINITGLKRWLAGGDPSYQGTDYTINYKKLGIMGQVIATMVNSADVDELKSRDYSGGKFLHHALRDSFGLNPLSGVSEALDQSFLQGMESFLQVLTSLKAGNASAERSVERFINSIMRSASASVLPNSLSAINRSQREFMPDMRVSRDMPLEERLATHFKYIVKDRFFQTSDLPIRVNWKGEDVPQTPDERNGTFYHLFDITNARQGASDQVTNEIWRLYESTGHAATIASTPKYANYYGGKIDVPNLTKKELKRAVNKLDRNYTFFDDEDFVDQKLFFDVETLAEVMRITGQDRYQRVQEFMSTSKYKGMSDEERVEALDKIQEGYNKAISFDRGNLRPHSIKLLDVFQDIYENEWGKDEE